MTGNSPNQVRTVNECQTFFHPFHPFLHMKSRRPNDAGNPRHRRAGASVHGLIRTYLGRRADGTNFIRQSQVIRWEIHGSCRHHILRSSTCNLGGHPLAMGTDQEAATSAPDGRSQPIQFSNFVLSRRMQWEQVQHPRGAPRRGLGRAASLGNQGWVAHHVLRGQQLQPG